MREVADRAGVAMSSVSRAISGHPDVSDAMRERVLAAVKELGYTPDLLAQGLRSRTTLSIGFVAGDISNPVLAHIVKGAETTLQKAGYSMLLTNSLVDPELDRHNIALLEQRRVDGLIVLLVREDHPSTLEILAGTEVPVIVVERDLPADLRASRVLSDHHTGMIAATEHLLELGHRRIALIGGQAVRPTRERRQAVEAAFIRHNVSPESLIVREGFFSVEHGARATAEILDMPNPPTALIAGANQIMVGALQVISDRGIELGRDLSFVGCDNLDVATLYRPPIAVVDRDLVALGRSAAELILSHLRDKNTVQREIILPTTFLPRPSCGPVPD